MQLFVSYPEDDKHVVGPIVQGLRVMGHQVEVDETSSGSPAGLASASAAALDAEVVLIMASRASVQSGAAAAAGSASRSRVAAPYAATELAVTPEDIRNKLFRTVRLREGYDQPEVDEFLDAVEATLSSLVAERDALRTELDRVRTG